MAKFAVDLLFKSKNSQELDKAASKLKGVDTAAKKAQGSVDVLTGKFSKSGQAIRKSAGGLEYFIDKLGRARKANGQFVTSAEAAANSISKTGRAAKGASKGVNTFAGAIKGLLGAYAVIQAVKFTFVKTAELETQTRSLKVLTGSMETARDVVKELQDFGNVTPFTSTELIDTAKRLKAFGVDTERLVDTTKRLGDVAGATGADLSGIATAYGQIMAKGRLQGEELLQLQERGIALQPELQAMYKLSGDEFRKALEKGQISAEAVELALQRLTETGGTYANGAIAQSDTLNGRLSTLQDNIQRLAQNIGRILKPVFEWVINQSIRAIEAINGMLGQWKKEDAIGRNRKFELQRQAAVDAESKFGKFNLSKEKDQYRKSQYQTYLNNEAAKNGVGTTPTKRIEQKVDSLKLEIPKLLGQTGNGNGTGTGTGTRQAAASKQLMGKVVELLTGDKSSQFYRADHGGSNYHVHVAFENQEQKELAKALLQSKGIQIGSENDGKHAPGSYHYSDQAFDVPMSQVPVGQEDAFSQKILGILGKEFGGLLGGSGGGDGGLDVIGQLVANARVEMDKLRESALSTWQSMQEGLLGINTNLEQQVTDLNEINRLVMEGMDPAVAEDQVSNQRALLDIDAERISKLSELSKLQGLSADELKTKENEINAAFDKRLSLQGQLNEGREVSTQLAEQQAQAEELKQQVSGLAGGIASEFTNAFRGVISGTKDVQTAFSEMLQGIADRFLDFAMQILQDAITQQLIGLFAGLLGGGGGGGGMGGGSMFGNTFGGFSGMSFAGGGYTGDGDRSGGVDGQGGFPAILHPNETVIDHTKGMSKWSSGNQAGSSSGGSGGEGGEDGRGGLEATPISISMDTRVINNVEYVTAAQMQEMSANAAAEGAKRGEAMAIRKLQMSPATRRRIGM